MTCNKQYRKINVSQVSVAWKKGFNKIYLTHAYFAFWP